MQELKQLQSMLEQMRKDIWHIVKVSLPELQNASGGGNKFTELENKINANEQAILANKAAVDECKEGLNSISASISEVNSTLSNLQTSVQNIASEITAIKGDINTTQASINTLQENVSSAHSDIDSLQTTLSSTAASIESQISTINSTLTDHQTQINNISSSGGGEIVDVLYDMKSSDANINKGMTSGMVGGQSLVADLSPYKKIIVYGALNRTTAVGTFYLKSRQFTDLTLHSANIALNQIFFLKLVIPSNLAKLQVNYAGWYTTNVSTGEITFARENGNASYFVHKIEGVR